MSTNVTNVSNVTNPVIDKRIEQNGGAIWSRLHSEREDICEELARDSNSTATREPEKEESVRLANWHRELLQARLRKVDDALDRLMSGSYGSCSKCGRWIEDTKLEFDPAIAFCIDCWVRMQSAH